MAPLEAMSHGLPVVVSSPAYCGFAQYLSAGKDALILQDPRNGAQLAQALERLGSEPELRASLAERGWPSRASRAGKRWRRVMKPLRAGAARTGAGGGLIGKTGSGACIVPFCVLPRGDSTEARRWPEAGLLNQVLRLHRQQQSFSAEGETRAFRVCAAAQNLLLCAQFGATHFETLAVQVIA